MGWNSDPELQELFRSEMTERVERLVRGGRAMTEGSMTPDMTGEMMREGHTIKGTGRVMGFEAISRGGHLLEQTWRRIQHGDISPSPELGAALEGLAVAALDAIGADPVEGTDDLRGAISTLNKVLKGDPAPASAPPATVADALDPEPEVAPSMIDESVSPAPDVTRDAAPAPETDPPDGGDQVMAEPLVASTRTESDLGGLLGAVETWAEEQMVLVNAGRLYRVINDVASLRIDTAAAVDHAGELDSTNERQATLAEILQRLDRATSVLEREALALATIPLREVTNTFPQLVRYLSKKTGKLIRFELVGDDLFVDREILERISDPLRQLIVNAVEHGVEQPKAREVSQKTPTAMVALRAMVKDHKLEIVVEDDGGGIDWARVEQVAIRKGIIAADAEPTEADLRAIVFAPKFSTLSEPTDLAGDGDGLAAVIHAVESVYGSISLDTASGTGTKVTITVPTSRALQKAYLVEAGGQVWGIPEVAVEEVLPFESAGVTADNDTATMEWNGSQIPVVSFARAVSLQDDNPPGHVVVLASQRGLVGYTVDTALGSRQVAAKELGPLLSGPSHLTGAALLGGGEVVLLIDPVALASRSETHTASTAGSDVLIVDDSRGVRQVLSGTLAFAGYTPRVAGSGAEAMEAISQRRPDAMVVDFAMPESDGISLVHDVRERFGDLPIVMLSAVATPEDQARARRAGVDAYFDKADFREGALAETLESLLAARTPRKETRQ